MRAWAHTHTLPSVGNVVEWKGFLMQRYSLNGMRVSIFKLQRRHLAGLRGLLKGHEGAKNPKP